MTKAKSIKEVPVTKTEEFGSEKNRPVKTFRDDNISASVWKRTIVKVEPKTYYSISLERSYQNANGEWRYSSYFNLSDGQKIVNVWKQAAEFIEEELRQDAANRAAA